MAIIRLNNTTVVYLMEVTKFLAMVCFLREESFERKDLRVVSAGVRYRRLVKIITKQSNRLCCVESSSAVSF
ncbi:unnamed protein product [Arctogadus glacialis]